MIKTQTKFEKAKANFYHEYSKNPPVKEKLEVVKDPYLFFMDDKPHYARLIDNIIRSFTSSHMFLMEEVLENRLYRLHMAPNFVMNLAFSYDFFKISIYDKRTNQDFKIITEYYKHFTNKLFGNLQYLLGRFIKAMDNDIHPTIILETMTIEELLDTLD